MYHAGNNRSEHWIYKVRWIPYARAWKRQHSSCQVLPGPTSFIKSLRCVITCHNHLGAGHHSISFPPGIPHSPGYPPGLFLGMTAIQIPTFPGAPGALKPLLRRSSLGSNFRPFFLSTSLAEQIQSAGFWSTCDAPMRKSHGILPMRKGQNKSSQYPMDGHNPYTSIYIHILCFHPSTYV